MLGHFYFLLYRVSNILLFTALTVVGSGRVETKNESDWSDAVSHLYSEHQTGYSLRVKKDHQCKVYNHEDRLHVHALSQRCVNTNN